MANTPDADFMARDPTASHASFVERTSSTGKTTSTTTASCTPDRTAEIAVSNSFLPLLQSLSKRSVAASVERHPNQSLLTRETTIIEFVSLPFIGLAVPGLLDDVYS